MNSNEREIKKKKMKKDYELILIRRARNRRRKQIRTFLAADVHCALSGWTRPARRSARKTKNTTRRFIKYGDFNKNDAAAAKNCEISARARRASFSSLTADFRNARRPVARDGKQITKRSQTRGQIAISRRIGRSDPLESSSRRECRKRRGRRNGDDARRSR